MKNAKQGRHCYLCERVDAVRWIPCGEHWAGSGCFDKKENDDHIIKRLNEVVSGIASGALQPVPKGHPDRCVFGCSTSSNFLVWDERPAGSFKVSSSYPKTHKTHCCRCAPCTAMLLRAIAARPARSAPMPAGARTRCGITSVNRAVTLVLTSWKRANIAVHLSPVLERSTEAREPAELLWCALRLRVGGRDCAGRRRGNDTGGYCSGGRRAVRRASVVTIRG